MMSIAHPGSAGVLCPPVTWRDLQLVQRVVDLLPICALGLLDCFLEREGSLVRQRGMLIHVDVEFRLVFFGERLSAGNIRIPAPDHEPLFGSRPETADERRQ